MIGFSQLLKMSSSKIFDSSLPEVWIAVGVLVFVFLVSKVIRKRRHNLPPGPFGIPVLGYIPFLTKHPHLKFIQLGKKYGDVFGIYMGSKYAVVLNDANTIGEAFAKRELLARPPNSPFELLNVKNPFFSPDFHTWQEQRRFVVMSMKDLGLGKSKIESHIQDEIQHFLNVLKESNGQPMNLERPLTPSMSNNICSLVFGERYGYSESNRMMLDHVLDTVPRLIAQTSTFLFFPWMKNIPFLSKILNYDTIFDSFKWFESFIEKKIQTHRATLDSTNVRDFIDSYLLEMKTRQESGVKTTLSDETLKGSIITLFGAGSETVRSSISWSMYTMASFPEVQEKVKKEIRSVLGTSRIAQLPDQWNMHYTQAVIKEIMRWKNVAPLNIFRYTLEDVEVAGYHIPKGTIVIANLWSVHHDPRYWEDPESFRPERFLDKSGKLVKESYFMPFSVGKRACPGEAMAMMEIFLYFVSILQKFKVVFPPGFQPNFEAELGITYHLKPYQICFIPRD